MQETILCICVFCLRVYKWTMCAQYPQKPKKVLDPLELELHKLIICHVDSRNQTQVLYKKQLEAEPW